MKVVNAFNRWQKSLRFLYLVVPACNWLTEIVLRWAMFAYIHNTKNFMIAFLSTIGLGLLLGYVDAYYECRYDTIAFIE